MARMLRNATKTRKIPGPEWVFAARCDKERKSQLFERNELNEMKGILPCHFRLLKNRRERKKQWKKK